ncbi:dual specificity protein phosphatase CDC14AB isoform X2 [Halyomorpha halys]|uniref:dual specificity protein phosphatase CDC14AB isoform X2 n=1 Tax=Halyomorpha halys TaxID=286706 RepID=UPI0006D521F5|nr:dual specificity protein phosphatase CDC14AB-like isoform X2 [Halyomorpha halys]
MKALLRKSTPSTPRNFTHDPDIVHIAEFVKNQFYLVTYKRNSTKQDTTLTHYFNIDSLMQYQGFYADFGPLNLGMIYRYCLMMAGKLNSSEISSKTIVHYTSMDPRKRANASLLAATFAVIYLNITPKRAWDILRTHKVHYELSLSKLGYLPYRDAQPFTNKETIENTISIYDCLKAIDSAFLYNFVDFSDFLLGHYEAFQINGYSLLNWIVPSKLLALCNPSKEHMSPININRLIRYFMYYDVGVIVRCNEATYNPMRFSDVGIKHVDLYFNDGTPPPIDILEDFLHLVEHSKQAVAVHCRDWVEQEA